VKGVKSTTAAITFPVDFTPFTESGYLKKYRPQEMEGGDTGRARISRGSPPPRARTKKISPSYARYAIRQNRTHMLELLQKLKADIDSPESAGFMVQFRHFLEESWNLKDYVSREDNLLISAIEESVRGKKWRELNIPQIAALENALSNVSDPSMSDNLLKSLIRNILKSEIDIYPSSPIDEDDDGKEE